MRLASFGRDRRGAVAIITALASVVIIGMAALAVDVGSIFLQSRQLQGVADLAAMAGANDLGNASDAVVATATMNNWRSGEVTAKTTVGTYRPAAGLIPADRFKPGGPTPNAVRVQLRAPAQIYFGRIFTGDKPVIITRNATAARPELASFQIGSRLAALRGGVANTLLSSLTGSSVTLTVMDYNALVSADVDLISYMGALQTHLHLEGASFDKALSAQITNRAALGVLADSLTSSGQAAAGGALRKIATAADERPADLGKLIDLGPYGDYDQLTDLKGAEVRVNALDIAEAMLALSQGGRQVKLDLGATVPGLADVDIWLGIGERPNQSPWLAVDDDGEITIRTAQMRLYVDTRIAPGGLGGAGVATVRLPVLIELASAEARLTDIDCAPPRAARSATFAVRPSLGRAAIADIDVSKLNDFKKKLDEDPATIVQAPLISATGKAGVDVGGHKWLPVKFTQAEIDARTIKTVETEDIVEATVASLVSDLDLKVTVAGLGLGLGKGPLTAALGSVLAAAAPALDDVLNSVTDLLGLHLGAADLRATGLRCKPAVLVS